MAVAPEDYHLDEDEEQEELLGEEGEADKFSAEPFDPESESKDEAGLWSAEPSSASARPDFSEEDLRAALAGAKKSDARSYAMHENFSASELILHDHFGLGIVAKTLTPKKMLVIFPVDTKILVMNYTPGGSSRRTEGSTFV